MTRRPCAARLGPAAAPAWDSSCSLAGRNFITIDMGGTSFDTCLVRDGLPDMRSFTTSTATAATCPSSTCTRSAPAAASQPSTKGSSESDPRARRGAPWTRVLHARRQETHGHRRERRLRAPQSARAPRRTVRDRRRPREQGGGRRRRPSDRHVGSGRGCRVSSRSLARHGRRDPGDHRSPWSRPPRLHADRGRWRGGCMQRISRRSSESARSWFPRGRPSSAPSARSWPTSVMTTPFIRRRHPPARPRGGGDLRRARSRGRRALTDEGVDAARIDFVRTLDLRYRDQVWEVTIDVSDIELRGEAREAVEERFHRRHEELYDFSQPGYRCELISLTVTAIGRSPGLAFRPAKCGRLRCARAGWPRPCAVRSGSPPWRGPSTPASRSCPATRSRGPAIIEESNTTIAVPPRWRATFHGDEQAYVLAVRSSEQVVGRRSSIPLAACPRGL